MTNVIRICVLLAICLCVTRNVHAQQRPLVTEDPETIGPARVLLEGGIAFDHDQTNSANGLTGDIRRIGVFGLSAGAGPSAEVQIDGSLIQRLTVERRNPLAPLVRTTPLVAGDVANSFGDLVIATKIRALSETESRPALGFRFGTKLPFSPEDKGVGLGTTDFFTTFLIAKTVQSVRTVGNVGLLFLGNPVGDDAVMALGFGASIARAVTNEFEVVGEVNGRLEPFEKIVPAGLESRAVFRLAGRYTYAMLRLDFGMLAGFTDRDPGFGISAGATYVIAR